MIISDIVRSANVVTFREGGGGGADDLSSNFRNKIKPIRMQSKTAQKLNMTIIMEISVDILAWLGFLLQAWCNEATFFSYFNQDRRSKYRCKALIDRDIIVQKNCRICKSTKSLSIQ
jgi:hypothetical protein